MSAPTRQRKGRALSDPALSTPPSNADANSTAAQREFDFDRRIVDAVNRDLWSALFDGHFRLAVRCLRCGRWLTDGQSKRRHYGATCAAKAGAK